MERLLNATSNTLVNSVKSRVYQEILRKLWLVSASYTFPCEGNNVTVTMMTVCKSECGPLRVNCSEALNISESEPAQGNTCVGFNYLMAGF